MAWELAHGPLPPKARVLTCPDNPACVRLDHLRLGGAIDNNRSRRTRARKGAGSMRLIRSGAWELRITVGRWEDGRPRTLYRSVSADTDGEAAAQLVTFVEEMRVAGLPGHPRRSRHRPSTRPSTGSSPSISMRKRAEPRRQLATTASCTTAGSPPSSAGLRVSRVDAAWGGLHARGGGMAADQRPRRGDRAAPARERGPAGSAASRGQRAAGARSPAAAPPEPRRPRCNQVKRRRRNLRAPSLLA